MGLKTLAAFLILSSKATCAFLCIVTVVVPKSVLVRVFQRNRTTRMCIIYRTILQGIDSHKYEGWWVQNRQCGPTGCGPRRASGAIEVWRPPAGEFLLTWGVFLFCLDLQLIKWGPPTWVVMYLLKSPLKYTCQMTHKISITRSNDKFRWE